ncbi:MAG: hypothetical protein ACKPKO_12325, partial [Candidatus Fonsibacter sp.]
MQHTGHVQQATLNHPTDKLKTLGATLGGTTRIQDFFRSILKVMQSMRHKLSTINDPAVKLKLAHHCLGESKAQRLLRLYGTELLPTLHHVDRAIDMALNRIATGIT